MVAGLLVTKSLAFSSQPSHYSVAVPVIFGPSLYFKSARRILTDFSIYDYYYFV